MSNWVLHLDMDSYFASIECQIRPQLLKKPMAVGGAGDSRGVICTANYLARSYGVHAGLSSREALKRCPHISLIPPNMKLYRFYTQKIFRLIKEWVTEYETLGLDEAYLIIPHFSANENIETLIQYAQEKQKAIYQDTGLWASIGIGPNKFLAKLASEWNKPRGIKVFHPQVHDLGEILAPLPLKYIPGIGTKTNQRFFDLGLRTIGDIQRVSFMTLNSITGQQRAYELKNLGLGIDHRKVQGQRPGLSLGHENTYLQDYSAHHTPQLIPDLYQSFLNRFHSKDHYKERGIAGLHLKIKFKDFKTHTLDCPLDSYLKEDMVNNRPLRENSFNRLLELFDNLYYKFNQPYRLLGMGIRFHQVKVSEDQLCLL